MRSSRLRSVPPLAVAVLAILALSSVLQAQGKRGYLGINLDCSGCERGVQSGAVVWWFASPPKVTWLFETGPAAQAGMREGDVILAIDGVEITSQEGGRLFGSLQLGVPVEFLVRRGDREETVVVTPGSAPEAFGKEYAAVMYAPEWDSVKVELKYLYEGLPKLRVALKQAERALARTEADAHRTSSETQLRLAEIQRAQIDSINRRLQEWHKLIRVYTDSLAARTLYVKPVPAPEVSVSVVPSIEANTITIYSDAVAGARFKVLKEGSDMAEYFDVSSGLLITDIVENTPAYTAGLREGDVVLAVNGQSVRTVPELRKLLRGTDEARLTYVRKGKQQTCTIPSQEKGQ